MYSIYLYTCVTYHKYYTELYIYSIYSYIYISIYGSLCTPHWKCCSIKRPLHRLSLSAETKAVSSEFYQNLPNLHSMSSLVAGDTHKSEQIGLCPQGALVWKETKPVRIPHSRW
jgi:hypothetical protein